jgi:hypothetical protein
VRHMAPQILMRRVEVQPSIDMNCHTSFEICKCNGVEDIKSYNKVAFFVIQQYS